MKDFNKKLVEKLQKDAEIIMEKKMPRALENDNEGTYRNLVRVLEDISRLIERYEWKLQWSKYRDKNDRQFISIWEQNTNGEVKNNKVFQIKETD